MIRWLVAHRWRIAFVALCVLCPLGLFLLASLGFSMIRGAR